MLCGRSPNSHGIKQMACVHERRSQSVSVNESTSFLDNNLMLIVEIAQQLRPMRFQCGSFLLICHWFVNAYPRCTLSHTRTQLHTLCTPFFEVLVEKRGRRALRAQDVRFIHISFRSMYFARENHSNSRSQ